MARSAAREFRRAGVEAPAAPPSSGDRWYAKLGLLLLGVVLLTLSFAPLGQFYLAWVGLVPWLLLLNRLKSHRAAFLWSWLAGILFFTANMWWLWNVTGPGMVALMFILGLYWAAAAVVLRAAGLLVASDHDGNMPAHRGTMPVISVSLIASVWVAFEWLRATWPLDGLPWLFLGHAQTPALPLCQIADVTGVYGVSFLVVSFNALVALFILHRFNFRPLRTPAIALAVMIALAIAYGYFRMGQRSPLSPGPAVLVVQPNVPQDNTGEKGAPADELIDFHVHTTEQTLRQHPDTHPVDLVVWSETMMPALNRRARALYRGSPSDYGDYGLFLDATHERLKNLAYDHKVGLLVGSLYFDAEAHPDPKAANGRRIVEDKRNTAYFYDRTGHTSDDPADRYDKIHIVPFGEYLPFKETLPPLYRLIVALSPYDPEKGYFLTPGKQDALTVFRLDRPGSPDSPGSADAPWRFVTPICFEDIDPVLVARMFRGAGGRKRADFIVNITNDGWFLANQMPQHLQAARFRSIENRAPTARSVNTGISGFVDSAGRVHGLVAAGTEGASVQTLQLDARLTLYTRFGDAFAWACVAATLAAALAAALRRRRRRTVAPAEIPRP